MQSIILHFKANYWYQQYLMGRLILKDIRSASSQGPKFTQMKQRADNLNLAQAGDTIKELDECREVVSRVAKFLLNGDPMYFHETADSDGFKRLIYGHNTDQTLKCPTSEEKAQLIALFTRQSRDAVLRPQ